MSNWKTTLFGAIAALGVFFSAQTNAVLHVVGLVLSAVGSFGAGAAAQDAANSTKS